MFRDGYEEQFLEELDNAQKNLQDWVDFVKRTARCFRCVSPDREFQESYCEGMSFKVSGMVECISIEDRKVKVILHTTTCGGIKGYEIVLLSFEELCKMIDIFDHKHRVSLKCKMEKGGLGYVCKQHWILEKVLKSD